MDIYQEITTQITDKIQSGVVPWRKPWAGGGTPKNLASGKEYRGINVLLLGTQFRYTAPYWLTFRQAKNLGGGVMKGEKSSPCVFWKWMEKPTGERNEKGDEIIDNYPVLRYYRVFNVEQTDGIDYPQPELAEKTFQPIAKAEKTAADMPHKPELIHQGARACYSPSLDRVVLPKPELFDKPEHYYSTLFHELSHSTGHRSRLDRNGIGELAAFGSHDYSKEELIAEMGAAFLAGHCGISPATIDNSAAYLDGWLHVLRQPKNRKLLVHAAAAAQKAADYILGR